MNQVTIPGFGNFEAEFIDDELCWYKLNRIINEQNVSYLFYPKPNGSDYSTIDIKEMSKRIGLYDSQFRSSVLSGVRFIRDLCEDYGEPLDEWSDTEVAIAVRPTNAKFEPEGWQESYCYFGLVHPHLDLVLRFDERMLVRKAYFDG